MRGSLALAIAAAIAAAACKRDAKPAAAPPAAGLDAGPAVLARPSLPRPRRVPAFVTLDEVTARHPTLTGLRDGPALALAESGKQATLAACATATDADATARSLADQYGAAGWAAPTVQRAAFAADFPIADGALHVQGQVRKTAACNDGELAVELSYTKMVDLTGGPPAPAPDSDRAPR